MVDNGEDIQVMREFIANLPPALSLEVLREVHHGTNNKVIHNDAHHGANVKTKTGQGGFIHNDSQHGPNNEAVTNIGDNKAKTGRDDLIHDDPTKEEGDGDE